MREGGESYGKFPFPTACTDTFLTTICPAAGSRGPAMCPIHVEGFEPPGDGNHGTVVARENGRMRGDIPMRPDRTIWRQVHL